MFAHFVCANQMQQQRPHGLADWHCSQGTQLDKQNGKLLCPGIRLINMPDPLGKQFFRHLWQKGVPTSAGAAGDYAAGYAEHRSREEAILHQLCLGHRLHKAKVGCATFLKDVANSFYGPEHVHLDAAVGHATRPCDKQLLKQRHRAASIHIQAADGEVLLAAGSGALQGDSIASDLFLEQYHPLVDHWLANLDTVDPKRNFLLAYGPVNQKRIDTSVTTYADNLAVKVLATTAHGLQEKAVALDMLNALLANGGLAQNRAKQEVVVVVPVPSPRLRCGQSTLAQWRWRAKWFHKRVTWVNCARTPPLELLPDEVVYKKAQLAWCSMGSF